MTTHRDDMRQSLGAYVLGALEPDEAAAVRRHLEECPECAAERDALESLPGLLSLAGGAEAAVSEPLSPAFEERLLDAYARDHKVGPARRRLSPRRWRLRWVAAGAATVVAAAAAAFGFAVLDGGESPDAPRYDVAFRSIGAPGASGHADLEAGTGGTTVHLWVSGLPREKDAVYEVLCDAETWTASAGTFRTDEKGKAYVVLTTALRKGEYDAIRIVRRSHQPDGRLVRRDMLAARLS
jgi:anti-sigma-K factor RskA